jgi:hypothetical protein
MFDVRFATETKKISPGIVQRKQGDPMFFCEKNISPAPPACMALPPAAFQTSPVVWNSFTKAISSVSVASLEIEKTCS